MLDKFEQIAASAEYAVVILANLETNDIQFVNLETLPADTARAYAGRGLAFIGTVGLVAGVPRVALAEALDSENITQITQAFIAHVRKNARWTARPDLNRN
jgi:hypothetical protein